MHMWGIMLQNELNEVCADFGLPRMELMTHFRFDALPAFAAQADRLEQQMREYITRGGGIIREYRTPEEFFHEV